MRPQPKSHRSALQEGNVVCGGVGPASEDGDDDGEADHDLGRRHHQHEEHDHLPADVIQHAGEGHEGEVHRVEHELDAHEHDQHVATDQEPDGANREQHGRQAEVPRSGNCHDGSESRTPPDGEWRASTTAPTTAITSRTDVISKARRYRVNSELASFSTLLPGPSAAPATDSAPDTHAV